MKYKLNPFWLTALLMLVSQSLSAHDFVVDGIYYRYLSTTDKTVCVTYKGDSYSTYSNEYSGRVVIPESVILNGATYSVTSIGMCAFYGCTGLTSIEIPNSVTSIGSWAFSGCTGLTNIEIPNSVTSIGESTFQDCSSLVSITLPFVGDKPHTSSETQTNRYPFGYIFGSLQSYNGVSSTEQSWLDSYNNRTSSTYYIPSSLKTVKITSSSYIPSGAFCNCTNLTNIEISNSVTRIGVSAFKNCTGLTCFTIPNSIIGIDGEAFEGDKINELIIEDGETTLTLSSRFPYYLTTLYLGRTVTGSPFTNHRELLNVTIGDRITSIDAKAFAGSLTRENSTVTIGKNVTGIGDSAFYGCKGTLTINSDLDNFLSSEKGGFSGAQFKEIIVGDNVTKICKFAFADMVNLRKVTLGKSVNRVLSNAFSGCIHLTELYCQPKTPPSCVTTVFDEDTYLDCTLYVPEESLEQYQTANIWKNFYDFDVNPDVTPMHKLIYRIDGNIYRTEMVEEGATIIAIDAPQREGYTFVGWSGMPDDMIMPDHDLSVVGIYTSPITATTLNVVDGQALDFSLSHTYEGLTYTRTFGNTNWQSLYVPFAIPVDSLTEYGLQVAELNDTHQWDFNGDGIADSTRVEFFTRTSGSTEANYPYLIRATAPTTLSLTLTDIEVKAAEENSIECSSVKQKFTFVGTYTGVSGADMYANNYYGMAGGGLKRVSSTSVSLNPQRWYMKIENKNGSPVDYYAPSIRFTVDGIDEEEETSGIIDIRNDIPTSGKYYSLEGIRQTSTSIQRGMYVRQGKKLIIR